MNRIDATAPAGDDTRLMLDLGDVVPWLRAAGVRVGHEPRVSSLGGGVSNAVMLVEDDTGRWIVKQSLGRLDVPGEWFAPRERILGEAAALSIMESVIPGRVPEVVAVDDQRLAIAMVAAPSAAQDWREVLFAGEVDPAVGALAGETLGRLHTETADLPLPRTLLEGVQLETLRLDPYFREAARRVPELSDDLGAVVDHLAHRSVCLVHGDYSPKNLLVWPSGLWVIDAEVAHRGEPAFDVAFLTHHLLMKAVVLRGLRSGLHDCWQRFMTGYAQQATAPDPRLLDQLAGALLLARILGKSPAAYLEPDHVDRVGGLGRDLLAGRRTLADTWSSLVAGGEAA